MTFKLIFGAETWFASKVDVAPKVGFLPQNRKLTRYLEQLITESSLPLRIVEKDFALDSSGFSTSNFGRYVDLRFGKADVIDRRKWVKVHLMCGVATHIVTAAQVSKPSAGDSPYLNHLFRRPIRISIFVRCRPDNTKCELRYPALDANPKTHSSQRSFSSNARSECRPRNSLRLQSAFFPSRIFHPIKLICQNPAKRRKLKYRRVEVLNRNLRGKLDLHRKPYKPTKWIFVEVKEGSHVPEN